MSCSNPSQHWLPGTHVTTLVCPCLGGTWCREKTGRATPALCLQLERILLRPHFTLLESPQGLGYRCSQELPLHGKCSGPLLSQFQWTHLFLQKTQGRDGDRLVGVPGEASYTYLRERKSFQELGSVGNFLSSQAGGGNRAPYTSVTSSLHMDVYGPMLGRQDCPV